MLESTNGRRARLTDFHGRALVIFHESYGHTAENEALKQWCGRASTQPAQRDRMSVLGVANLHGLGRGATRRLVTMAVRVVAKAYGIELWMDFDRTLTPSQGAHVFIIAPDGREIFHAAGRIEGAQQRRFHQALEAAMRSTQGAIAA